MIEGYVEAIEGSLFNRPQSIQVSILCPQPYFVGLDEIYNDISSLIPAFEFPFSIAKEGIEFSYLRKNGLVDVVNEGDVATGIIVHITARGEVVNPIINANGVGSFGLNFTLEDQDQVIINTNSGERSVTLIRDSVEINIIDKIQANPTWFVLQPGENIFSYEAEVGRDLMSIIFRHRTKFGGV